MIHSFTTNVPTTFLHIDYYCCIMKAHILLHRALPWRKMITCLFNVTKLNWPIVKASLIINNIQINTHANTNLLIQLLMAEK